MLNGNCVSMFEKRLHNIDIFPICDSLEIFHAGFIVSCDLSFNMISDSGANSIARMLRINSSLLHLCVKSNAITEKGAADIADALKTNTSLTSLDLSSNPIEDRGGMKIAEMLPTNCTLKFLNLSSCDLKTASVTMLSISLNTHPSLQELRIAKPLINSRKEETITHIAQIFKENNKLRSIDLSFFHLSDSGVTVLFKGLFMCRSLTHLRLGSNCITTSCEIIARYLENPNCALKHLDVSANRVDTEGGYQIAKSLIKNKTLQYLDLSNNNIEDESLSFLANVLESKNEVLKKLLIADNKFDQTVSMPFSFITYIDEVN